VTNNTVFNFLLSILASFIAGIILIWAAALVSQQARWVLTGLLSRLLNVDIDYVFNNKYEAQSDIEKELSRTHDVLILTSRGNELQRRTFATLFHQRPESRQVSIRILLPKTEIAPSDYDWVRQREGELAQFDPAFGKGLLKDQIEGTARFLQQHLSNGTVELRRFNHPHIGRVLITDRFLYYTPYRSDAHGSETEIFKFRRGGGMYDNFRRLFEQLWDAGASV
jgi:hypothetical protein